MSEEVLISDLISNPNVGDNDYVLVWTAAGSLVRVLATAFKSQNSGGGNIGTGWIRAQGIWGNEGQTVALRNLNSQGLEIDPDGVAKFDVASLNLNNIPVTNSPFLTITDDYQSRLKVTQQNTFQAGQPVRLNNSSWVTPAAGAQSPDDEWYGIVQTIDSNNFYVVTSGKATIAGITMTPGQAYYWNGTAWEDKEPTAYNAFRGKIVAINAAEAIVLPFKRRSGAFRPAQSSPEGAGQINVIFRSPNLPANTLLAGVSKGSGTGALFKSVDNGITWTKVFDFPGAFTSLTDISQGPGGLILLAMGFTSNLTGTTSSRDWIYTIPQALTGSPAKASAGVWGSVGRNLNAIAYDGSFTYAPLVTRSTINNLYRSGSGSVSLFSGYAQIATSEVNDTMVFNGQVYFANNSSIHKTPISGGAIPIMPGATFAGETLSRLAYNTTNNKTVLVGTKSGNLYRTEDFTAAIPVWSAAIKPGTATVINDIAFNGSVWFVATNDGLYRSSDDGITWSKIMGDFHFTALGVNDAGMVLAGTNDGKVFIGK